MYIYMYIYIYIYTLTSGGPRRGGGEAQGHRGAAGEPARRAGVMSYDSIV